MKYQFIHSLSGRRNVVCFRNKAKQIINEKWYNDRDSNIDTESIRIIEAAAQLIKANIRESTFNRDEYPTNSSMEDEMEKKHWILSLLEFFKNILIGDDLKKTAIGHCIVQASGPWSVIAPVLLSVGVATDHMVGSKSLLQMLSRLGLSVSNDEVIRFKQSVIQADEDNLPCSAPGGFTCFSADNVDHNIITLNGLGTFHGMGIISMTVPCPGSDNFTVEEKPVKRLPRATTETLTRGKGVVIHHYNSPNIPPISLLKFDPLPDP